jgi:RNA polymerase-binding transcription factor DksA
MGTHLQIDSGLSAESVRTRQTLHCDDAENDPRVNRESCRACGIASVVVMPLIRGEEVYGVFELLAGRPRAFEERDFIALQRLSEMIQTALDLADAARRAERELGSNPETPVAAKPETEATSAARFPVAADFATPPAKQALEGKASPAKATAVQAKVIESKVTDTRIAEAQNAGATTTEVETKEAVAALSSMNPGKFGKVRNCEGCGFPISEGRRLCLDCEAASPSTDSAREAPQPFGLLPESEPSWIRSHVYLIATVLLVVATIAVVVWRF